jgi:Uma2 family endonuclease
MAITNAAEFVAAMPDASQLLSEEPEIESSLHYAQLALLVAVLEWWWRDRQDFFIGANLSIYFSTEYLKNRDFRGPDFFLVKGVDRHPRKSWVVWEEGGKYPDLIIELLSDSTEDIDRDIKLKLYQDRFRTPEYFWFSPYTLEFAGWELVNGKYQKIEPNEKGWLWSAVLELYLGVEGGELRYFTREGEKAPSPQEDAFQERRRAEQLARKLRELGIDPDAI